MKKTEAKSKAKAKSKVSLKSAAKGKARTKAAKPAQKASKVTAKSSGNKSSASSKKASRSPAAAKKTSFAASARKAVSETLETLTARVTSMFSNQPNDIESAVKMDHEGLRNFMDLLKDTDRDMGERRRAYEQFPALLKSHTIAEEKVVYKTSDELTGRELHIKIAEGYVEHQMADDLMKRIEAATDPTEWSAHANVLSEIVEHHLREEERDLLPLITKGASPEMNTEMVVEYIDLREQTQTKVTEKNAGVLDSVTN